MFEIYDEKELIVVKDAMNSFSEEIQTLRQNKDKSPGERVQIRFFPIILKILRDSEIEFIRKNQEVQDIESP